MRLPRLFTSHWKCTHVVIVAIIENHLDRAMRSVARGALLANFPAVCRCDFRSPTEPAPGLIMRHIRRFRPPIGHSPSPTGLH